MLEVSKVEARRALMRVHGFDSLPKGIDGLRDFFVDHPCVQVDSIDVAGTNQDFTLFSRVEDYKRRYLEGLLYQKRELFEYFCKMMSILPVETYPLFKNRLNFGSSIGHFLMNIERR